MIIESISFFNAGVFRGPHSVNLAPSDSTRFPIVLIGGKNGRGKTTLLDSIHFVLYGKNARLANRRGGQGWDDFLKDFKNRQAPTSEMASVGLAIRLHTEGVEHLLEVQREWKVTGTKVKETLTVKMDGEDAPDLANDWIDYVESLIPSQIAHLFLFDGEQIEALAAPEKAREILRTGIYGLLGADLVGRLDKDLQALERRIRLASASVVDAQKIESLEQDFLRARQQRDTLDIAIQIKEKDYVERLAEFQELQHRIQAQGGDLLEHRVGLEVEERSLLDKMTELEVEIRRMHGGILPLAGVIDLLNLINEQATREQRLQGGREWLTRLEARDRKLIKSLSANRASKAATDYALTWLQNDRESFAKDLDETKELYGFTPEGFYQLRHLLGGGLAEEMERHKALEAKLQECRAALELIQRRLARIPDQEAIRHLLDEREVLEKSIHELEFGKKALLESRRVVELEANQLDRRLQKETAALKSNEVDQLRLSRQVEHLQRARETVVRFKEALVARDIERIEKEILLSAQRLFSKKKLITGVSINPETFHLTIRDAAGLVFSPLQLSAGERQILAISVLWGLSKASGKSLPVFIDTPLGRLDHDHRDRLVASYFPHASHQVVLLSTDEEITPDRYKRMTPWVGRVASLVFDEVTQSSRFEADRFFDDPQSPQPAAQLEETTT